MSCPVELNWARARFSLVGMGTSSSILTDCLLSQHANLEQHGTLTSAAE
jgi:hypothetical protein